MCLRLLLPVVVLAGCTGSPSLAPTAVSCQPWGYSPAPVAFSYARGPVTAFVAEQTAVALFRSCSTDPNVAITITDLTSTVRSAAGDLSGPNPGQEVWLVQVDAMETMNGGGVPSHYLVEVNKVTGVPTVIAYG